MKILELFSGYGTASFALKKLGLPYELVGYSDIDKYANQVFKQNHCPEDEEDKLQLGDATLIDPNNLEYFDLLTGGFPCQSFSVAGKGLGELDPRGTLFYEIIRIAEVNKPRYMLLENVKGLTNKNHKATFEKILSELARIGYKVHWKILNTKDYGIPQNRERVWFVCFREQEDYDKFTFPEKEELKIFIKDILETEPVNSKYYLNETQVKKLLYAIEKKKMQSRRMENVDIYSSTLLSRDYKDPKVIRLDKVEWDLKNGVSSQQSRVYSVDGTSPTLGTNASPKIFALRSYPRTGSKEVDGKRYQNPEFREDGCSNTLTAVEKDNMVQIIDTYNLTMLKDQNVSTTIRTNWGKGNSTRVINDIFRKLTPKECFRLQGFLNDEVNLGGISDTQKYKLAGNGQSVNVVTKLFKAMFKSILA